MTTSTSFAPLPQAPTAALPTGATVDGAARAAWQPNVLAWIGAWRLFVVSVATVAVLVDGTPRTAFLALAVAGAWGVLTLALAPVAPRHGLPRRIVHVIDLGVCVGVLALANDQLTFSLLALYACSTVVEWASGRPVDAFAAAGLTATGYVVLGLTGPYTDHRPAAFVGNLALFFFFALATSGFFTVVRRIGALEIATEISRERGRYRRDLHDRLGQALCGLHFEVQAVHTGGLDDDAPSRMQSLASGYGEAQAMLRDLFRGGDEPMMATNVASVIGQEARRMAQQTGIRIGLTTSGDAGRVPPWMRPHVCAIAGESMHNAIKNGEATGIDIDVTVTNDLVVVSVTDDGVGFDNPPGTITEKEGHYGLREMAERARICGGEVVIASQPGLGARVRLQVPLPDGGSDDIIERDASRLRDNVWSLLTVLRVGLGAVALGQLVFAFGHINEPVVAIILAVWMAVDILVPTIWYSRAATILARRPRLLYGQVAIYGALLALCLATDVVPWFMLYAPLTLLAAGVYGGRRLAQRLTLSFVALVTIVAFAVGFEGRIAENELRATLMYVTNLVILGLGATEGSKLLDRLETLQIRVRYQVLARLRQGLGTRMRDQLVARLDELETVTRALAAETPTPEEFATATLRLQTQSSELKQQLRDIVHTLADPSPTHRKAPSHV